MKKNFGSHFGSFFVDALCTASVVGIWPRFIEPHLLTTTSLTWDLPASAAHLEGLRIVQFTDLHFHKNLSLSFLKRISRKIRSLKPDLIFFTGDFLCYSQLEKSDILESFLCELHAPHGCFCVFGNHDYANYVSRTREGVYDVLTPRNPTLGLFKGIQTLLQKEEKKGCISKNALETPLHEGLCNLLQRTPFTLLENTSITLPIGLNIVGVGEYGLAKFKPEVAFTSYQKKFPGIVLCHNPDTFPKLKHFPGNWVFAGHTHGEQIHFPFLLGALSKKLARIENPKYTRGLFQEEGKIFYVNRGVGGAKPLRFCSPPEILSITFKRLHGSN